MNRHLGLLPALAFFLSLSSCAQEAPPADPALPAPVVDQLLPQAEGQLLPEPPTANEGVRNRRRMDLDQLEAAILTATGGIYWGMRDGESKFSELAQTLGKPDYFDVTIEDLSPSMLFQKFLGDAARDGCDQLIERELAAVPEERIFVVQVSESDTIETNPEGVQANLRYLLERFHSTQLEAGSPLLSPWSWLFESSVHVTNDPAAAWRTVCVGLVTHPDFYSY